MRESKKILKNTMILYFRMILIMIISLYTFRIVLDKLGVEDYGIYNIVGGVVGLFSFLQASLSGASIRFLNNEIPKNNAKNLQLVFNNSLLLHIVLALFLLFLVETVGLYILYNYLNIEEKRLNAAFWVFQISTITVCVSLVKVTYQSAIIARERMSFYAYISIIEAVGQLVVVYILTLVSFDKLITYSLLIFIVSLSVFIVTVLYCNKKIKETIFCYSPQKKILISMLSFFSLDLYGNFCVMTKLQGINVIQNHFFGVIVNASMGVSNQIVGAITSFVNNFTLASKSHIMQSYAANKIEDMQKTLMTVCKFSFFLLLFLALPFIFNAEYVMELWLKNIPDYAVVFCQLTLLASLIDVITKPLNFTIHATGKIRALSFITGTFFLIQMPIVYYFLSRGATPIFAFYVSIVFNLLIGISRVLILNKLVPQFNILEFVYRVLLKCIFVFGIVVTIIYFFVINIGDETFYLFIYKSSIICSVISISIFFFGLNRAERFLFKNKFKKLINR